MDKLGQKEIAVLVSNYHFLESSQWPTALFFFVKVRSKTENLLGHKSCKYRVAWCSAIPFPQSFLSLDQESSISLRLKHYASNPEFLKHYIVKKLKL